LAIYFINPNTGYPVNDTTLTAEVYFFDPAVNLMIGQDITTDPFYEDLLGTQTVLPQNTHMLFAFSQTEWSYLTDFGILLSKIGLPFVPRKSVTALTFTSQQQLKPQGFSEIYVYPSSTTKRVNTLTPTTTLFSLASSAGGTFSLISFVYIVLFGRNRLKVWGLVHRIFLDDEEIRMKYYLSENEALDKAQLKITKDHYLDMRFLDRKAEDATADAGKTLLEYEEL